MWLQVYKGVVSEYKDMVNELMSGNCIAMEIVATDGSPDVVSQFRELTGPADPVGFSLTSLLSSYFCVSSPTHFLPFFLALSFVLQVYRKLAPLSFCQH